MQKLLSHRVRSALYGVSLGLISAWAGAEEVVLTVRPESASDSRYEYTELLLTKIMEVTAKDFGPARVAHADFTMSRDRTFSELKEGKNIHVTAEPPKPDWVTELTPVYIPIRKGMSGYRIFLIDRHSQAELSRINSLEELKQVKTGVGAQWSTAKVLRDAGFNTVPGRKLDGLYWMLMGDRFKTFGRGINEAPLELAANKAQFPDMAIETDLVLYMPLPNFFFVSPKHPKLAKRLEVGLKRMMEDGTFDDIFYSYHMEMIEAAHLDKRKVFAIENNTLPKEVPFEVEKYWYKPGDEKKYKQAKAQE